ncbi:unnamed protein product, partial [Mesorhabditis belari]|uniref:Uncharacterized protein n=1 Tax=Mesorhabditis belari TaxID=2138241 RepID=A0AAF3E8X0_9BILA
MDSNNNPIQLINGNPIGLGHPLEVSIPTWAASIESDSEASGQEEIPVVLPEELGVANQQSRPVTPTRNAPPQAGKAPSKKK